MQNRQVSSTRANASAHVAAIAVVAIISTSSVVGVVSALFALEPSTRTLLILCTLWLATFLLVYLSPSLRSQLGGVEGVALLIFVGATFLTCFLAQLSGVRADVNDMWRFATQALAPALAFWGCHTWAATRFSARPIDLGMTIVAFICVTSVFLQAAGLIDFEEYGDRYFGFMGDSVAWLISCSSIYLLTRGKYSRAALCVTALMLTQSRGALVVFLAALCMFLLFANGKGLRRNYLNIGIFILLALIVFAQQQFLFDILARFSGVSIFENDRIRTIGYTLNIVYANPLAGLGYGAHTYVYLATGFQNVAGLEVWATPVSTSVQVLADSGLIGFVPFAVFVLLVVWTASDIVFRCTGGDECQAVVGLGVWVIAFLLLNQSAAWLVPGSAVSPVVFATVGLVVGARHRVLRRTGAR